MNTLVHVDWVIIGILSLSTLVALFRGFVREGFSLATWVVAGVLAFRFSDVLAIRFEPWMETPSLRIISGFLLIFLIILLVGSLLGMLIGQIVKSTGLTGTDRLLGALFGLARGIVIVVIAVILAAFTPFPDDPWWEKSLLLPYFETMAEQAVTQLPPGLKDQLIRSQGLEI
jgi:membrane protein required for colicin V production